MRKNQSSDKQTTCATNNFEAFSKQINGVTINFSFSDKVYDGHGFEILRKDLKENITFAFIKSYKFTKNKPVSIDLLSANSEVWIKHNLNFGLELKNICEFIEFLASHADQPILKIKLPESSKYRLRGGF